MTTPNHKVFIKIFAMPMKSCDPAKTWKTAFHFLSKRLKKRYGDRIVLDFIEIFSPESFQYQDVMKIVEEGKLQPPYIFLNKRLISNGGKLSERVIAKGIDAIIDYKE